MKISNRHKKLVNDIFNLLDQEGITAYQVWQKTKIDQGSLSKAKSGKEQLSMSAFMQICDAFGIDIFVNIKGKKNKIKLGIISSIVYYSSYTNRGLCSSFPYLLAA